MGANRSIFITGGGSGIGRAVAQRFAREGWFVLLADIDEAGMDGTAALLPDGSTVEIPLDVRDRDRWAAVAQEVATLTGGRLDVLFNNAGIGKGGPIEAMAPEDVDALIAINLTGVVNGTQALFALLQATPGACVLNTSSAAGIYGSAGLSVYSATKFAVRGLTEAWDIEFAGHDIRARSLMPGFIDTAILAGFEQGSNRSGKEMLQGAGIEVSPVEMAADAAWAAVHGDRLHTPVNKMARGLMFAARWFPGRLRKRMGNIQRGLEKRATDPN